MGRVTAKAFENVFDQVGYCGIWCGSCAVGTSALTELARRYRDLCESHGLGHWGAEEFDYAEFIKGLDAISRLPGCAGCLQGGGREHCEIRSCARERGLRACSSCDAGEDCPHLATIRHMREGAKNAGLLVAESASEHDVPTERRRRELSSLWWWRALVGDGD